MQIIVMCVLLTVTMFFVPSKYKKMYSYISVFMLASLYLFLDPPKSYDLSRHYNTFEQIEKCGIKDIINGNATLQIFFRNYPLFTLYMWIISKVHIKELLPFSTGIIVYGILIYILNDIDRKRHFSKSVYALGYIVIVLLMDFVDISGIRNITAATIFALSLYLEFVNKKKKTICFALYILCGLIHSVAWLYLAIRIAVMFYNRTTKVFIKFIVLFLFALVPIASQNIWIQGILERMPVLKRAYVIFLNYANGDTGGANLKGMIYLSILLYLFSFCVAFYFKKTGTYFEDYDKLYDYFILSMCFTVGSYMQYDLFVRFRMIMVPFLLCFWLEVMNKIHKKGIRDRKSVV